VPVRVSPKNQSWTIIYIIHLTGKNIMSSFSNYKKSVSFNNLNYKNISDAVVQVYIFYKDNYLGFDCFNKDCFSVGSGNSADIKFDDIDIPDIAAFFSIKDSCIVIENNNSDNVFINGDIAQKQIIKPLDIITIGKYLLKIKLKPKIDLSAIHNDSSPNHNNHLTTINSNNNLSKDRHNQFTNINPNDDIKRQTQQKYHIVFQSEIYKDYDFENVKHNFKKLFNINDKYIEYLFSGKEIIIKQNLRYKSAIKIKKQIEKIGAVVHIVENNKVKKIIKNNRSNNSLKCKKNISEASSDIDKNSEKINNSKTNNKDNKDILSDCENEQSHNLTKYENLNSDHNQKLTDNTENSYRNNSIDNYLHDDENDDDENDDDDFLPEYSLEEILLEDQNNELNNDNKDKVIEITKFISDSIIDISYLKPFEKYYINKHLLVEYNKTTCFLNYNEEFQCKIYDDEENFHDLKNSDNSTLTSKKLYQSKIPETGYIILEDDDCKYKIRKILALEKPEVPDLPHKKTFNIKNLCGSIIFHFFVIFIASFFISLPEQNNIYKTPHFVKIENQDIIDLKKKLASISKKNKVVPEKKEIKKELENLKIDFNKKQEIIPEKTNIAKKQRKQNIKKNTKKVRLQKDNKQTRKSYADKKGKIGKSKSIAGSPGISGGFQKGNTTTKDINQQGILSILGNNNVPSVNIETLAPVTNLDAIETSNVSGKNFRIGGVAGKLGNSKIEINTGSGRINTMGSSQVIRTAMGTGGIGGNGKDKGIAYLEKGDIGQKKVKSLVTANLSKRVQIMGGMSREVVKKVIDEHIDDITYCYEMALIEDPSIMGKAVFEWKILMNGNVSEISVSSSSVKSGKLHSCIKSSIQNWSFPKPKALEVAVSYPFVFDVVGF